MKATDYFKQTIQSYLQRRAQEDELFATPLRQPEEEHRRLYNIYPQLREAKRVQRLCGR